MSITSQFCWPGVGAKVSERFFEKLVGKMLDFDLFKRHFHQKLWSKWKFRLRNVCWSLLASKWGVIKDLLDKLEEARRQICERHRTSHTSLSLGLIQRSVYYLSVICLCNYSVVSSYCLMKDWPVVKWFIIFIMI